MKWAGHMVRIERREITEKIGDKRTGRLQKMRKTTAKMGRDEENWREKANNMERGEKITKSRMTSVTPTKGKRTQKTAG